MLLKMCMRFFFHTQVWIRLRYLANLNCIALAAHSSCTNACATFTLAMALKSCKLAHFTSCHYRISCFPKVPNCSNSNWQSAGSSISISCIAREFIIAYTPLVYICKCSRCTDILIARVHIYLWSHKFSATHKSKNHKRTRTSKLVEAEKITWSIANANQTQQLGGTAYVHTVITMKVWQHLCSRYVTTAAACI